MGERIAVLMGGVSQERPISLRSGEAVVAALQQQGMAAEGFDVRTLEDLEAAARWADVAFLTLHGRWGEDGTVQGILDTLALPYTGSGLAASALAMDKMRTKLVWQALGLPTPAFDVVTPDRPLDMTTFALNFPVMVKPAHEGSSIGMARADTPSALHDAVEAALALDTVVLIEQWIEGAEYTAGIVGEQVLPLIRVETPRQFYDFTAKYAATDTRYHCPCGLDPHQEGALAHLAMRAFQAVGAQGWGRVDMMVDESGQSWLIEVNTLPGMTDHSLVPMAAQQLGWDFATLVMRILETVQR
ncbi:MAG TPA: D-alanine--D-alanine ligase [Sulfurivirga caldicuralii]|nr:D-alanine--D-alanine ligase [Sulfurivirga caldicuralii]